MNTLKKLTAFQLSYYVKPRFESKNDRNKFIGILFFLAICFMMPIGMMIYAVYISTGLAVQNGVLAELMSSLFLSSELATIVLGTMTYVNIMYFAKDNRILETLPIKSIDIYLSRLVVCFVSMLMLSAVMVVPSIISVAVSMAHNGVVIPWSYYVFGILSIVTLPLITLMLISIIAFPIMKIVSFLKKKPVLFSLVTVLFTLGIMALMYSLGGVIGSSSGDDLTGLEMLVEKISQMGKYSYATLVLSRAMIGVDIGVNIAIYIGILIGSLLISIGLSVLLYRSTLSRLDEDGMSQKMSKSSTQTRQEHPIIADIKREIKVIIRSPELLIQTIMMLVVAPLLIVIFGLVEESGPSPGDEIDMVLFFTAMTFFYECITVGLNYLASIGISREREMFSLLKSLPISSHDIIRAKLIIADVTTIFMSVLASVVYAIFSKDVPWYSTILMIVMVSAQGISLNAYSLYRDVKKPNLKWMTVREITKNNFGAIVPMLISMAVGILLTMLAGIISFVGLDRDVTFLIFWAVVAVVEIVFYFLFRYKKAEKMESLWDAIEV